MFEQFENFNLNKFIYSFILVCVNSTICAQPPALIPYQAIARDAAGDAVMNQNIGLRFSIHDQTITGTTVWQEAQTVLSNPLGVVVTSLGSVSNLSAVNWANGDKFLQVEMDITGGTNYSDMGTQQMMSVPYALYAGQAGQANQVGGSSLSLGDSHEGGVVVYLDQTGQHGLIMADSVFSADGMILGYRGLVGGGSFWVDTDVSIGSGDINTESLFASSNVSSTNSVLLYVVNSNHGGYDDWFIPSRDELRRIYFDVFLTGVFSIPEAEYISSSGRSVDYGNSSNSFVDGYVVDAVGFWNGLTSQWTAISVYDYRFQPNLTSSKFLMLRKF
jgi:hypothetical protein